MHGFGGVHGPVVVVKNVVCETDVVVAGVVTVIVDPDVTVVVCTEVVPVVVVVRPTVNTLVAESPAPALV